MLKGRRLCTALALLTMAFSPPLARARGRQDSTASHGDLTRNGLPASGTADQRNLYRDCDRILGSTFAEANDVARIAGGPTFFASYMRARQDELRERIQSTQKEQKLLLQGLSGKQKNIAAEPMRDVQESEARVSALLREMDDELAKNAPDAGRVAEEARGIAHGVAEWQMRNRQIGEKLGLSSTPLKGS